MELIRTRAELPRLDRLRARGPLVLVPTMGALHDGHLALVRLGQRYGPVVVSLFVNPKQFGPQDDFTAYPRDLRSDLTLLEPLAPAAVFAPAVEDMYPHGTGGVTVLPGGRAAPLCGAARPGHFAGVLTVVAKLLHLVRPEVAVFGRKDAQQCLVIAEMVRDLDFPVRLIDAPTERDSDGLALSSRNRYLSDEERQRARCIPRALAAARSLLAGGERDVGAIAAALSDGLTTVDGVEYAEVRSLPDLLPLTRVDGRVLLAIAARVGRARLIDNLVLDVGPDVVIAGALLEEGLV